MRVRFVAALLSTILKASLALRGAFLLQAALMLINNLLFFATWWLIFQRFEDVRGYRMHDMLALFGVSGAGFGVAVISCGGSLHLARAIADGQLDGLLTQPKSVLLRAVASRSQASGWGDIASSALLLALSGYVSWRNLPLALLAVALAATMFVATAVLFSCAAFWLRNVESVTFNVFHFVVALSLYPPTLFGSGVKLLLFTVLPAALVSHLPVELVRNFQPERALYAVGGVLAYGALALFVFQRGLARYTSGSRFGVWG